MFQLPKYPAKTPRAPR